MRSEYYWVVRILQREISNMVTMLTQSLSVDVLLPFICARVPSGSKVVSGGWRG